MTVLYFGCWSKERIGHYLYRSNGMTARDEHTPTRLHADHLDGTYCPAGIGEQQGPAHLHHVHGWTVLAFWDRSADRRGASNAAFLADGTVDFKTICQLAEQYFPEQWKRITSAFALSFHAIAIIDMLRVDGDRATVTGTPDGVAARLRALGPEWMLKSLDLGHHIWSELQARFDRARVDRAHVAQVTVVPALLGTPIERDMQLEGHGRFIRANLVRGRHDGRALADAIADLCKGVE